MEVAYVVLEVPDAAGVDGFFTAVVGLASGPDTPDGHRTVTDDAAAHRVIVAEGPANDLVAVGFDYPPDAFDAAVARAGAAERPDLAALRRVDRLAVVAAPWGGSVELVTGLDRVDPPPATPLVPGGFLTAGQGFGHVVVATLAFDESVAFLVHALGFAQSDWLEQELAPGIDLEVRFFHCNPRHHTMALARAPFELPSKLHHLMFETNDRDDVGAAFDRAFASNLAIPNGLGRHDNDGMFSFYVASPAGFQVEVGHGAVQIAEPWTGDRQYDRISAWGHQPVVRG